MRLLKKLAIWLPLVSFAEMLMASESGHGINWWHLGAAYKDAPALGWLTITFVLFVYGVSRAIKKPLSSYLATRSKDIKQQIEEGRLAKIESEKKLLLYDEKLQSLGQEIEKMKASFIEQAHAEKRERERLAKEMEGRILRDTDDTIRANIERSKNRLAEEVINRAISLAEITIMEKKRDQVDEVLKMSFVDDLRTTVSEKKREHAAEIAPRPYVSVLEKSAKEVH